MNRRWSAPPPRDQEPSAFADILQQLCWATSARAAALVDVEGETVDYAASGDPFEIKVAAAEWRLLLSYLHQSRLPALVRTEELFVRAELRSYYLAALGEGYAIVLELPRRCFRVSQRAVRQAAQDLSTEAGLSLPDWCAGAGAGWRRVQVATEKGSKRPAAVRLERHWQDVSVIGRYAEAGQPGEIGYRVRLSDGNELSLVREPLDFWYLELTS